jgi:hypothetical protein
VTEDFLVSAWSLLRKKIACQDRNMLLLMEPCAAHNEKGTTLKHFHQLYPLPKSPATSNHWTTASYRVEEINILKASSMFYIVVGGMFPQKTIKMENTGSYGTCFHGTEIHH